MGYKTGMPMPIRRIRRMHERHMLGTKRMSIAPTQGRPMRVVVRAQPNMEAGEELLLLGALEELKRSHDRIDLEYCTERVEIVDLLKGNWFLRKVHIVLHNPTMKSGIPIEGLVTSDRSWKVDQWDDVVGEDYGFTAFEPDPQAAVIAEEDRYRIIHQAEVDQKTFIWESYQARGMKDIVKEEVPYNFQPRWHKINAYLWSLSDRLGIQIDIPFSPIFPYGEINKNIRKRVQPLIAKSHITDSPFGIYDLRNETDEIGLVGIAGKMLHPINMVSIQVVEKELGSDKIMGGLDVDTLLCLLQHNNCKFVIAPVGNLLYSAWAAGVDNVLFLYTGVNHFWDGVQAKNSYAILRDRYEDTDLPG
ncbi:MAG TPA: hypothetical protein VEP90_20165, partial [Methylomirabilota bacterium]|nr:hypothetical protein [Methylomirabilota bacterium]